MTVDGTHSHTPTGDRVPPGDHAPPGRGTPRHGASHGHTPPRTPPPGRLTTTRRGRRIAMEAAAMLASTALVVALPSAVQSFGPWSPPVTLSPCSAPGAPAILFPSDEPRHGTGPGAIVWSSSAGCAGGTGARVSAIDPSSDLPGPASTPLGASGQGLMLAPPLAAEPAPHGQILLAGSSPDSSAAGPAGSSAPGSSAGPAGSSPGSSAPQTAVGSHAGATGYLRLSEGSASGPFTTPSATGGPNGPLALTSAYLGDVALVSPGGPYGRRTAGGAGDRRIELLVHRYFASSFSPPVPVTSSRDVEGLTLAMDYRSDALVVWERDGAIYARDMPGSNRSGQAVQRVASAAPGAHIAAVLSDDDRAILAWSETRAGVTSVYVELSGTGPRFGPVFASPRLLERFADPGGHPPSSGAPRLIRLSSESVMLAWSGAASGHWVVQAAPVYASGVQTIGTISAPGRDSLLLDLAPGPANEAYALWSEPTRASATGPPAGEPLAGASGTSGHGPATNGQAVYAARGIIAAPGQAIFTAPTLVSAPGATGVSGEAAIGVSTEASIGVDPDSDRAIAAWRTPAGAIDYSLDAFGGD